MSAGLDLKKTEWVEVISLETSQRGHQQGDINKGTGLEELGMVWPLGEGMSECVGTRV